MKILISTGDVSGDFIGALLVRELRKVAPEFQFFAVGGEKLKAEGVSLIQDCSDWSAIGIFDALPKVPKILLAFQKVRKKMEEIKPQGAVFIDCPAFNTRLARALLPKRIPSVYFFPPSPWKSSVARAAQVGKLVSRVIAPFPQSAVIYESAGVSTFFSGHPFLDILQPTQEIDSIAQSFHLNPKEPVLGLFPGSRRQEIQYHLPLQLQVAKRLKAQIHSLQFILPAVGGNLTSSIVSHLASAKVPVTLVEGRSHDVMRVSTLLLLSSGTATLEALLLEKPMVILYKLSPWSWLFQRPFLKGIQFAGLPNLLAGREIVPEFLQDSATEENLAAALSHLFQSPEEQKKMILAFREIRAQLGAPPVMEKVARDILRIFHNQLVIPTKVGIQGLALDPRLRGDDKGRCGDDKGRCGDDKGRF